MASRRDRAVRHRAAGTDSRGGKKKELISSRFKISANSVPTARSRSPPASAPPASSAAPVSPWAPRPRSSSRRAPHVPGPGTERAARPRRRPLNPGTARRGGAPRRPPGAARGRGGRGAGLRCAPGGSRLLSGAAPGRCRPLPPPPLPPAGRRSPSRGPRRRRGPAVPSCGKLPAGAGLPAPAPPPRAVPPAGWQRAKPRGRAESSASPRRRLFRRAPRAERSPHGTPSTELGSPQTTAAVPFPRAARLPRIPPGAKNARAGSLTRKSAETEGRAGGRGGAERSHAPLGLRFGSGAGRRLARVGRGAAHARDGRGAGGRFSSRVLLLVLCCLGLFPISFPIKKAFVSFRAFPCYFFPFSHLPSLAQSLY